MTDLKVFGSNVGFNKSLVAAESKAEAMRIIGETQYQFDRFWSETGNTDQIHLALKYPKELLVSSNRTHQAPWYKATYTSSRPYDDPTQEPVQ